ncbi:hypothetical protein [Chromatocurvus halotolerans]|uniref:Uncharacterized protein n=1 Tax=Chromatocurvus halotolerans TaxID=1132028 RepID=A0A4R2LCS5_9GAMM|nr:hypothetical protein [Chromatocurvus halotolerans]TCO77135.1 hypothetical protein EV688_103149 [Chromatocurvus halotolerans]
MTVDAMTDASSMNHRHAPESIDAELGKSAAQTMRLMVSALQRGFAEAASALGV